MVTSNHRTIGNGRILGDDYQPVPCRPVVRFTVGVVRQMADTNMTTDAGVLIDDGTFDNSAFANADIGSAEPFDFGSIRFGFIIIRRP